MHYILALLAWVRKIIIFTLNSDMYPTPQSRCIFFIRNVRLNHVEEKALLM